MPPRSARSAQAAGPHSNGRACGTEGAVPGSGDTVRLPPTEPGRLAAEDTLLRPTADRLGAAAAAAAVVPLWPAAEPSSLSSLGLGVVGASSSGSVAAASSMLATSRRAAVARTPASAAACSACRHVAAASAAPANVTPCWLPSRLQPAEAVPPLARRRREAGRAGLKGEAPADCGSVAPAWRSSSGGSRPSAAAATRLPPLALGESPPSAAARLKALSTGGRPAARRQVRLVSKFPAEVQGMCFGSMSGPGMRRRGTASVAQMPSRASPRDGMWSQLGSVVRMPRVSAWRCTRGGETPELIALCPQHRTSPGAGRRRQRSRGQPNFCKAGNQLGVRRKLSSRRPHLGSRLLQARLLPCLPRDPGQLRVDVHLDGASGLQPDRRGTGGGARGLAPAAARSRRDAPRRRRLRWRAAAGRPDAAARRS